MDIARIIDIYYETLTFDSISLRPGGHFLYTGRAATEDNGNRRQSRFYNVPMGINAMRDIGKDVAKFLKLENADQYTGHCFPR